MVNQFQSFLQKISESFNQQGLIKITLGNKRIKSADLKNVFVKPVTIKGLQKLSFTYRNTTQDIFKNYDLKESLILIEKMLQTDFFNADLFTAASDFHLAIDKNEAAKLINRPASLIIKPDALQHDKQKQRVVNSATAVYLHQLGITSAEGVVKKDMQDKFKQINRYVEIIEGIIKEIDFGNAITVADMGSGKGYLTFALYDYLTSNLKLSATVTGIEMREDLINKCNQIATHINYDALNFKKGTIQNVALPAIDMLIALHACDTATDDAIYKGIQANAKVIICAPCCHKQIRKQMVPDNELKSITKHGILLERQAEIVTDSIRALILEAHGYKTKVFDFIATEHTPKNVMIAAVKNKVDKVDKDELLKKVSGLKGLFNIESHYLEKLLLNNKTQSTPL
jgi:tRNA A58 N-methylase Trm61